MSALGWNVYWHEYVVVLELANTTLTACMLYSIMPTMMTLPNLLLRVGVRSGIPDMQLFIVSAGFIKKNLA